MTPRMILRGLAVAAVVVLVVLAVVVVGALLSDTRSSPGVVAERASPTVAVPPLATPSPAAPADPPAPNSPSRGGPLLPSAVAPSLVPPRSRRPVVLPPRPGRLPVVPAARLPLEARRTLAQLDEDASGGMPFADREGLLPRARAGCYRAYEVSGGLLVVSCAGPRYWGTDGGASFAEVVAARL